MHYGNPDVTGG